MRELPPDRGFLVAAGLDDALAWLEQLSFGEDDLAAIDRLGIFDDEFRGSSRPGEHRVGELVAADAPIDGFTKLMGLPILVRVSSRAVTVTSTELIVGSSSPRCR